MKTLILQAYSPLSALPDFCRPLLARVQDYARQQGFAYRCLGDEFLAVTPPLPVWSVQSRADLARLIWMERLLDQNWDRVIWMDTDLLLLPGFRIEASGFAVASSLAPVTGQFRSGHNNALLVFDRGHPFLPFYRNHCLAQSWKTSLATGDLGPTFLAALAQITPIPVVPGILQLDGRQLQAGPASALALAEQQGVRLQGVNLTASLLGVRYRGRLIQGSNYLGAISILDNYKPNQRRHY